MKRVIVIFLLLTSCAYARVQYPRINHVTKELYLFEKNQYEGIAWDGYPILEAELFSDKNNDHKKYLEWYITYLHESGYKDTSFPYKIELFIFFITVFHVLIYLKRRCPKTKIT